MRNVFILAAAAAMAATVAHAEPTLSGSMEVEINKDAEATLTLGAGLSAGDLAFGSFNVESVDGGSFDLDQWQMGADVAGATLSFGDQDGVFVEGENGATLSEPAMAESLKVSLGDAQVAVGLTDWNADITDISNVQGAYTVGAGFASITASGDYNLDSEEYMLGGRADGVEVANIMLGSTLTYGSADEKIAYEVDGTMMGVTAYLNGDDTDTLQNVGASYGRTVAGLDLGTELNYNLDTEEFTPNVTVGFKF
jgi:hypothetical protein